MEDTKVFETIESYGSMGLDLKIVPHRGPMKLNLELAVGGKKFVDGTDITDPAEDGEDAAGIITYGLAHVTDAAKNPELLLALRGVNSNSEVLSIYADSLPMLLPLHQERSTGCSTRSRMVISTNLSVAWS